MPTCITSSSEVLFKGCHKLKIAATLPSLTNFLIIFCSSFEGHLFRLSRSRGRALRMLSFPEQSSIFCATPEELLDALKRLDTLLPKVIPGVIRNAQKIQGDGGAGTIVEYVYAPEFAEGRTLKMTTEVFDEANRIVHSDFQVQGDYSRYSSFKVHLQLFPGLLEGTTRSQWRLIYEPDNAPPPLDIIATAHPSIVAFSDYLHSEHEFGQSSSIAAESQLTETIIPSASPSIEPAKGSPETIPSASSKAAGSHTKRILSESTERAESLTETIPSASTEPAKSLTETTPSASTKPQPGVLPKQFE